MQLSKPSHLLPYLDELGAAPRKKLSQNFLIDRNILDKIVKTAEVEAGDEVLEIGPGPGALTEALLAAGASVTAIEMDPLFAKGLSRLPVRIFEGDALRLPWPTECNRIVANLPYHITSPLIVRACEASPGKLKTATLLVQREVAERLVAEPGGKMIGSLSLFVRFYATPKIGKIVSRNCFYPAPRVDSAILHLTFHTPPLENPAPFHAFVRKAFQQRRKTLPRALDSYVARSTLIEALHSLSLSERVRPEELSLEQWIDLYQAIRSHLCNL